MERSCVISAEMRKSLTLITLCAVLGTAPFPVANADIQDPPAAQYTATRKLARGLANILYGITEIPSMWTRVNDTEGSSAAATYGTLHGVKKTGVRFGYGIYEVLTFPIKSYKGTYRPVYKPERRIQSYPFMGYEEFPPQLGIQTQSSSNRIQTY